MAEIAAIGRQLDGGPLVNISTGGDGRCAPCRPRTREKIRAANLGYVHSKETRRKMSVSRKGVPKSEEHKRAIGNARRGVKFTAEQRQRLTEVFNRPEVRKRKSAAIIAYHQRLTDEQKIARSHAISVATKIAMQDESIRAKISKAARARRNS